MLTIEDIESAVDCVEDTARETPLTYSNQFSQMTGTETYLKLENQQRTGSFKIRGATNKIHSVLDEAKDRGVVTASAGNHAQGVALAASRNDVSATVVMPESAPNAKVDATEQYGADAVLHGETYDDAHEHAESIAADRDAVYVPAYDDEAVMAGQGTLGFEILQQCPEEPDVVAVPIGGGGLISGVATAIKSRSPKTRVVGVEAELASKAAKSVESNERVTSEVGMTIADGIATKSVGERPFQVIQEHVDEIVSVSEEAIATAITYGMERSKTVLEGAGATPLAAHLEGELGVDDGEVVALLLSGGNIDMLQLSSIVRPGLHQMGRYARLQLRIEDSAGALNDVLQVIADADANVYSINHDRTSAEGGAREATVEIDIETRDTAHIEAVLSALQDHGYSASADDV